jgi:eukaryotic-like serine/threonine-protein kinase
VLARRAVLVTGPPGAGKSRLRHEFLRHLRERFPRALVWLGRGDPLGGSAPFGVLAPALRRALGVSDAEPAAENRSRISARVAERVAPPERGRVAEFLGELVGVPFPDESSLELSVARGDPTLMGDQLKRAFEQFLAAECALQPVVVVLDDLHWGDLPSVSFMSSEVHGVRDRPLFVLGFARPEAFETFPVLRRERKLETVRLGGLTTSAGRELIHAVLGAELDGELVARLIERADGNAFHLEELIRAVAEGRAEDLPESVLASAEARILALAPEARRVLRGASVFGRIFHEGGVLALLGEGGDASATLEWLGVLCDREFVERRAAFRYEEHAEYVFRHALLCDAAYAMLTDDDRKLGHALAGGWLEKLGEPDASVLAEHFARGAELDRAAVWFARAAEQALEGHDFVNAIVRAERGIACGASGAELGALKLLQAEAYRWRGEFAEASARAAEGAGALKPGTVGWFRAVDEILTACGRLGTFEVAAAWAERAAARPGGLESDAARVTCLCSASRVLFHAGRYDLAERLLRDVSIALEQGTEPHDPRVRAEFERSNGARARHAGDVAADMRGYAAALGAFQKAGDERNACNARVSLGFAYAELGELERAAHELEQALSAAERMGLSTVATRARQNLGLVCAARGELGAARQQLERVLSESRAQGNVRFEGWTCVYLSRVALARGELGAAEEHARAAAAIFADTPPARAGALAALALCQAGSGAIDAALENAGEAMGVLRSFGGIEEFESLVRAAYVEALRAAGDEHAARVALREALERLNARAAAIDDPALRRSFLERVPDNRRLVELGRYRA